MHPYRVEIAGRVPGLAGRIDAFDAALADYIGHLTKAQCTWSRGTDDLVSAVVDFMAGDSEDARQKIKAAFEVAVLMAGLPKVEWVIATNLLGLPEGQIVALRPNRVPIPVKQHEQASDPMSHGGKGPSSSNDPTAASSGPGSPGAR